MGFTQWGAVAILGTAATLGTFGQGGQQPRGPIARQSKHGSYP